MTVYHTQRDQSRIGIGNSRYTLLDRVNIGKYKRLTLEILRVFRPPSGSFLRVGNGIHLISRLATENRAHPNRFASTMPSPSTSQNVADENDSLIRALKALSKKDKRLVKSSVHVAPADPTITVRSWKMNEYKYAVHPSPFPTLARGLFTRWVPGKDATEMSAPNENDSNEEAEETGGQHTIVARGYDKFFNIGEVPWSTVCA
jgi:RNA ligase